MTESMMFRLRRLIEPELDYREDRPNFVLFGHFIWAALNEETNAKVNTNGG
jgi:hypothetical protein